MKVLFIRSGNNGKDPISSAQGLSLEKKGINVFYYDIIGKGLWGYLKNIKKLRNEIKKSNPDLIHAHYSFSGFLASFAMSKVPVIVSLMGSDVKISMISKGILIIFIKYIWKQTIVKTLDMKKLLGIPMLHVIPNGVNTELFLPINIKESKIKLGYNVEKCNLLFAANPQRYVKNFQLFVNGMSQLDNEKIDISYLVDIHHNDIPAYLNASDVVILTSLWEGSPNVIKEAMACNRPIVCTNVGDVEWLFGNEPGHYITSFESNDVVKKLQLAIEFSSMKNQTNGRARIISLGLDSDNIANKLIKIYQSVIVC